MGARAQPAPWPSPRVRRCTAEPPARFHVGISERLIAAPLQINRTTVRRLLEGPATAPVRARRRSE